MSRIAIASTPADRTRIRAFAVERHGVYEYRWTFFLSATHDEVLDFLGDKRRERPRNARQWDNEWSCEERLLVGYDGVRVASPWSLNGRTGTRHLRDWLHEHLHVFETAAEAARTFANRLEEEAERAVRTARAARAAADRARASLLQIEAPDDPDRGGREAPT